MVEPFAFQNATELQNAIKQAEREAERLNRRYEMTSYGTDIGSHPGRTANTVLDSICALHANGARYSAIVNWHE